jgi:hypothetical protein
VIYSGQGLNLVYLLEQMPVYPKFYSKFIGLRNKVIVELNKRFEEFGSDKSTSDITRINKTPGTTNYKTGQKTAIIDYDNIDWNNLLRYKITDLAYELDLNKEAHANKKAKPLIKKTSTHDSLYTKDTLNQARAHDIWSIVEKRNEKQHIGFRYKSLFIYGIHLAKTNMCKEHLYDAMHNMNDLESMRLDSKEFESTYEKAIIYSYLNYKNETIIAFLNITDEEMKDLKTIISRHQKNERVKTIRMTQRRNSLGHTQREQAKIDKLNFIAELLEKGYSRTQIMPQTGLSESQVKRYIREIRLL